ncbi:MAG TPA: hypothetical protein VF611_03430 [Pyrinomonadaceae bacterium]|jgi:hypothetical protein
MRLCTGRKAATLLAVLALTCAAGDAASYARQTAPPNPVLVLQGLESFQSGGKDFTRYRFGVDNFAAYPDAMFAASPQLPPCGQNKKASRTWVDVYAQDGKRLNGFCAFGKASDLNSIWFALESDAVPPSWVYVELTDRAAGAKYKSNLADTAQ